MTDAHEYCCLGNAFTTKLDKHRTVAESELGRLDAEKAQTVKKIQCSSMEEHAQILFFMTACMLDSDQKLQCQCDPQLLQQHNPLVKHARNISPKDTLSQLLSFYQQVHQHINNTRATVRQTRTVNRVLDTVKYGFHNTTHVQPNERAGNYIQQTPLIQVIGLNHVPFSAALIDCLDARAAQVLVNPWLASEFLAYVTERTYDPRQKDHKLVPYGCNGVCLKTQAPSKKRARL